MQPIPVLLQSTSYTTSSSTNSATVTFNNPTTAGSSVIMAYVRQNDASDNPTIPDGFEITSFSGAVTNTQLPDVYVYLYYNYGVVLSGTTSITFTDIDTGYPLTIIAMEFANFPPGFTYPALSGSGGFDSQAVGNGTQLDSTLTGFTNWQGQNLLIGLGINDGAQTMTPISNFTGTVNVAESGYGIAMCYFTQGFVNVPDAQLTMPVAANWVCFLQDFVVQNAINFAPGNTLEATSATSSVSLTLGNAPMAGDVLLASVYTNAATPVISGWTQIITKPLHTVGSVTQFYLQATGSETTVTATSTSATVMELHVYELTFASNPLVIDGTPQSVALTSPSITTDTPNVNGTYTSDMFFGSTGTASAVTGVNTGGAVPIVPLLVTPHLTDAAGFFNVPTSTDFDTVWTGGSLAASVLSALQAHPAIEDPNSGDLGETGIGS